MKAPSLYSQWVSICTVARPVIWPNVPIKIVQFLLGFVGFALQLHLGHLTVNNTSNYFVYPFLAEVTSPTKVLNQVLTCSDIRIHSHTECREFSFFLLSLYICDLPKSLRNVPILADHGNSWPWDKTHNSSQTPLSQDLFQSFLFFTLMLFCSSLVRAVSFFFATCIGGFPAHSPYKNTACAISAL